MKERVLQYLEEKGSITTWEAIMELGITRLSAYIYWLRKYGYNITDEIIQFTTRYVDKSHYKKYILIK